MSNSVSSVPKLTNGLWFLSSSLILVLNTLVLSYLVSTRSPPPTSMEATAEKATVGNSSGCNSARGRKNCGDVAASSSIESQTSSRPLDSQQASPFSVTGRTPCSGGSTGRIREASASAGKDLVAPECPPAYSCVTPGCAFVVSSGFAPMSLVECPLCRRRIFTKDESPEALTKYAAV